MTRVIWTRPAREDLREIRGYIAQDSERYARVVVARLVVAVRRLREYPLSGRVVPELGRPTVREVIEGSYRIVYRVTPDAVQVLAVYTAPVGYRPSRATRRPDVWQPANGRWRRQAICGSGFAATARARLPLN